MAILPEVESFLDTNGARYTVRAHRPAFTAQEVAAVEHVPGRDVAKVVMVKAGGRLLMVVVPATEQVDVHKLPVLGARLATETEFGNVFPHCEVGAMPPFGNLYGLRVFLDERLAAEKKIVFQAGSHAETVHMAFADFRRLVQPAVGDFALRHEAA